MPEAKNPAEQLMELQEKVKILSVENEILAERAEDSTLLGLIAEKINQLEDPEAIIATGLEQISLLKDIIAYRLVSIDNWLGVARGWHRLLSYRLHLRSF